MQEQILQQWRDRGIRLTKLRQAMLGVISKSERPLSASQISEALKKKGVGANKTSVYREVQFLQEEKLVHAVHISAKEVLYEWSGQHHPHLVCNNCETVEELELGAALEKKMAALEQALSRRLKFEQVNHALEFFGLCRKCR
jgi:Fur family transcriptional regulator, ferric uptake regulator